MENRTEASGVAPSAGHGLESLTFACTAIAVADLDRAAQWYRNVFGFTDAALISIHGARVALLKGAGTELELIENDGPHLSTEPSLFADPPDHLVPTGNKFLVFAVEDLGLATVELQRKGVPIIWREKALAPGIVSTAVRDVEGNFVHIVQR
jgi:catechol 2,3-dioxygenase-like lactoylglutathione lyase family enzyme